MDMVTFSHSGIREIKNYAKKNNIPIMQDKGISYLTTFIVKNQIKNVLEIGTAIGYSAIMMALSNQYVKITSVERDEARYLEALKNIKKFNLEDRINLIFKDALDLKLDGKYDLVFLDASKGQNINFFKNFSKNLESEGFIITDNMSFHGFVDKDEDSIKSKNLRGLVRKIKEYKSFLEENEDYETRFLDIGDGLAISRSKK